MSWLRLTVETDADHVKSLTDLFEQFNAASVSLNPASGESLYSTAHDEAPVLWKRTSISALFDIDMDMDILLACLRNRIGTENIFGHQVELLKDREWSESYKQNHGPIVFGDSLCVCPSWIDIPEGYQASIIMDPGLAFGTGTHPTTGLCLQWLVRNDLRDKVIIDYGCGSGILSLAAARLGAGKVYAVDIDPQAVTATQANVVRNNLQDKIQPALPEHSSLPAADILIANILLNPLLRLAPTFKSLLNAGGILVLSGILSTQLQECLDTYNQWFTMRKPEFRDEWSLLYGSLSTN